MGMDMEDFERVDVGSRIEGIEAAVGASAVAEPREAGDGGLPDFNPFLESTDRKNHPVST